MKIRDIGTLYEFGKRHADVRSPLADWIKIVEQADWHSTVDIRAQYPKASILADNRVVFNIKGNDYRLLVHVNYKARLVIILQIGTHAEYDKWKL